MRLSHRADIAGLFSVRLFNPTTLEQPRRLGLEASRLEKQMDQQIPRVPAVERRAPFLSVSSDPLAKRMLVVVLQALLRALHRRAARPPSEPPPHLHKDIGLPEVDKRSNYWDHF